MIATIKIKDLIKYLVGLIMLIFVAVYSTRFFSKCIKNKQFSLNINYKNIIKSCICIASYETEQKLVNQSKKEYTSRSGSIRILDMELPDLENEEAEEIELSDEVNEIEEEGNVREEGKLEESYTNSYGSVKIKNDTSIKLTENMLKPDFNIKNSEDIIIYHTHTCESYTPTEQNKYISSGNYRTTDMNYSVVRVGRELEDYLEKLNFNVIRSENKHDYPAYSGSYTRSLESVEKLLKNNTEAEMVFDLHRDAIGSNSNFAPTIEIEGEKVAQLMFVIGTNDGGGKHPNWNNNLKFAIKIQEKANEMYPGLFRNINLRSSTFNQKVTNAAAILEVGATGNTLEEACASMKYFAKVLDVVLNET